MNQPLDDFYQIFLIFSRSTYFFVFGLVSFLLYYKKIVEKKPKFICPNKSFKSFLLEYCKENLEHPIYFTFYAFGSLLQTVIANYIRSTIPDLKYTNEFITLPDQGELSLDWYEDDDLKYKEGKPILLVLPGLTGTSQAEYVKSLIPVVKSNEFRLCAMNNRGRSSTLKTPRLYCVSNCEDLDFVSLYLKSKYKCSKLIVIGISLGANVLVCYLAEKKEKSLIDAAMCISPCFDFFDCYTKLENDFLCKILNRHLTGLVKDVLLENQDILKLNKNLDFNLIEKARTLRELDFAFNIKMWNFKTVDSYLKHSSLVDKIELIRTPTLFLAAEDDIFTPRIPVQQFKRSTHVALVLTKKGGHCAFMDNMMPLFNRVFYVEKLAKNFVDGLISLDKKQKWV